MAKRCQVPICICDAHGDALFYWGSTHAGRPRAVFHVDSHADMMTNWANQIWTSPGPSWRPPSREALAHRLAQQVDLANFIPSSIFQGFVDSVVWLRSDFDLGQYNDPPPGHYKRLLAMPDYGSDASEVDPIVGDIARPLVAFFELEGESFVEYGPPLVHDGRREILKQRRPGLPVESNTQFDDGWNCGRPPVQTLSAAFDHSVVTLGQLLADSPLLAEVRSRLHDHVADSDWILDIDLDYFATYCPLMAYLLRKHDWLTQPEAEAFASWAIPLGQLCSQGLERATQMTLFAPEFQPRTVHEVVSLPFDSDGRPRRPSASDLLGTFRGVHAACEVPAPILQQLSRLVCGLTGQQLRQWASLQADDWWWVMQKQGPHHYSTQSEVSAAVRALEPVLHSFSQPPCLVTIARSSDMYMPEGASDIAEWEVLLLLKRMWPAEEERALPSRLEDCGADRVEHLLANVTFYPTSRPLPGQDPEPLAPRPWPWELAPACHDGQDRVLKAPTVVEATSAMWHPLDLSTEVFELVD